MANLSVFGFTTLDGASRIEALRPFVQGRRIRTVIAGGFAAIVGERPRRYLLRSAQRTAMRRLKAYQRVLETAMVFAPVLPAKFETVMTSEARVRACLASCASDLRDPLEHYGPLIQFEILVSWSVIDAISRLRDEGIIGLRFAENADRDESAALALRSAVEGHRRALTERIRTILSGVALDVIETARIEEDIVANFTILVRRADEFALDSALERLDKETGGHLHIRCIGPLPSCSFAAVEVGGLVYEDVAAARRRLDIGDTVSPQELKRAYHKAIKALHPDLNPGLLHRTEEISRVRDAYAILTRIADGQLRRKSLAAPDTANVVQLDSRSVEDTFTIRLRRMGDGSAEAA